LKRILPILLIILFSAFSSQAQTTPPGGGDAKIVRFYPNPATSYINFEVKSRYQKGLTLQVYSFLGKKMFEQQNVQEKTTVNLTEFTRGVYVYHLIDASGKIIDTNKFQVTK
jgi:hypothetical protein